MTQQLPEPSIALLRPQADPASSYLLEAFGPPAGQGLLTVVTLSTSDGGPLDMSRDELLVALQKLAALGLGPISIECNGVRVRRGDA